MNVSAGWQVLWLASLADNLSHLNLIPVTFSFCRREPSPLVRGGFLFLSLVSRPSSFVSGPLWCGSPNQPGHVAFLNQ